MIKRMEPKHNSDEFNDLLDGKQDVNDISYEDEHAYDDASLDNGDNENV